MYDHLFVNIAGYLHQFYQGMAVRMYGNTAHTRTRKSEHA
uniref:Uncharacterized protein n=1 Tax=Arundo donax TaxID=35708 RepID=A0A0A9FK06_ARUDO